MKGENETNNEFYRDFTNWQVLLSSFILDFACPKEIMISMSILPQYSIVLIDD